MSSTVNFSVPGTDGAAGRPATVTSFFVHIPAAPSSQTCLFDWNLNAGYYYRCTLGTDRHVRLVFSLSGYGSATVDLGAIPVATWTWLSCGFATTGGLHVRGDMTPLGAGTTTVSVLAASGSATGTTLLDVAFGIGVVLTSTVSNFPNNAGGGWLMSKLIVDQISANAAGGNPRPMPTTEFTPSATDDEYLAHDPLGAATILTDSGSHALDLPAGPQGLTIVDDGPALLPSSPGPAGAHEGDMAIYQGGAWVVLHIGTTNQELRVQSGYPAWSNQPVATTSTLGEVKVGSGLSVAGDGTITVASGTGLPSGTEGDILVYKSGAWTQVGAGTVGQVLLSDGTDPYWGASPAPTFHWEPLTDPTVPELIFDAMGDVIMVPRTP